MNAIKLFRADTNEPIEASACGRCGLVWHKHDIAERCCLCVECGQSVSGPNEKPDFYGTRNGPTHQKCKHEKDRLRGIERMDQAEKVDSWDGWVYSDGHGHSEGYFDSVEEFAEWWEDEFGDEPLPEYIWTCRANRIVPTGETIMERLLQDWLENGWEDMDESDLSGLDELKAAVEAFSEANKDVVAWCPNFKVAVRMRGET